MFQASLYTAPPIYTHLHQQFIGVVPEPLTGPVLGVSLIIAPAIFLSVETIFHAIITHPYSDDLGYYGRFHRGVWVAHKGLLVCCGEDLASAKPIQASPPPYFVSARPSISFAAHQDHITQYALATDTTEVLRDDEKIV